ncbi:MAG: hypothetical protein Q9170_004274 [Blastenia crenularia]
MEALRVQKVKLEQKRALSARIDLLLPPTTSVEGSSSPNLTDHNAPIIFQRRTGKLLSTAFGDMSDSGSDVSDMDPPWGSLAAERYILVSGAPPSAAESSSILRPWRTLAQREVADYNSMGPAIWLRTCYSKGSDRKHEALVQGVEMEHAVDGDHRLLDDPDLYNYGADWQRVFDVIPELLEPNDQDWASYEKGQRAAMEELRAYAEGGVDRAERRLIANLTGASGAPGFQGAELEFHVARALQSNVHRECVVTWVVVEDEEALETGDVGLMFVDGLGRVIRSKRVLPEDAQSIGGLWADGSWDEVDEWVEADFGPEYQAGGPCASLLLESMRSA